jgi:hypothetical protein
MVTVPRLVPKLEPMTVTVVPPSVGPVVGVIKEMLGPETPPTTAGTSDRSALACAVVPHTTKTAVRTRSMPASMAHQSKPVQTLYIQ